MTYKDTLENLSWITSEVDSILKDNINVNGIIHSASYDLALNVYNNVSEESRSRILLYSGTSEKRDVLHTLKTSKNKVLIGPSLLEGLNMTDDFCRFNVFLKVPYLSLGDRFVATKLKLNPKWYQQKAILSILQGVGRSNRHENDWSNTYILDACFVNLLQNSRSSFPKEFIPRLVLRK